MSEIHESKGIYLYGNVALVRGECPKCGETGILKNGVTQCCNVYIDEELENVQRMTEPSSRRGRPTAKEQKKILIEQGHRCIYCLVRFGSQKHRDGKKLYLAIHYDHRMPFVYNQDNRRNNFVAACQVCNGIKSSTIFETLIEARDYIAQRRKEKGYDF